MAVELRRIPASPRTVRHSITWEEWVCYWYGNSRTWTSAPADNILSRSGGTPHIPTYEGCFSGGAIPALPVADYVGKSGMACICVAVEDPELGSVSPFTGSR